MKKSEIVNSIINSPYFNQGYDRGYQQGKTDGYSQAEKDYYKQTEKDRQSSYDCGYQQGKADAFANLAEHDKEVRNKTIEELRNIFCEDFFNRFAWDDGTINFNNCSLMIYVIMEKLKEG